MTINAGFKNQWFAYDLTLQQRYDFNKYCYASYLLSVHVNAQNKISSRMGISPMTLNDLGNVDVTVEPFFIYDIGIPTHTNTYSNFTNYRVGNNNLYARKFSKGLVLVNPFNSNMSQPVLVSDITGNSTDVYLDPENNNQVVTTIQLNSREAKLLLKFTSLSVNDNSFENGITVFPNPTTDRLTVKFKNNTTVEAIEIDICNIQGVMVKSIATKINSDTVNIDVSSLPKGVYLLKTKGIKEVFKFVKL